MNCKTTLQGDFCHYCGQKKIDNHQESFLHTIFHLLGDFIHFDSQIFRTAIPLLFKPGFLVNEYFKGKRMRYLPPVRMYVFLSFLFFFLTFSLSDIKTEVDAGSINDNIKFNMKDEESGSVNQLSWQQLSDTIYKLQSDGEIEGGLINFNKAAYKSLAAYDSVQASLSAEQKDNWWKHLIISKTLSVQDKFLTKNKSELAKEFVHNFIYNFPKLLFLLLPFFALLMKLLYRNSYFVEHFIFSIQFYNFFFLFGSLMFLISLIPVLENISNTLSFVLPLLYLFIAMRSVYQQSRLKTLLKFSIFFVGFSLLLFIGLTLNVLFSVFNV